MYTNAQWIDENGQHAMIRVDINGVTSFVPLDPANSDYAAIMRLVEAGELVIAPAAQVAPPPTPSDVSFWQFMAAAASLGVITWAEAEAAVATRAIPALFVATLDRLPEPQRTMARIKYAGITRVFRGDDLFGLMVSAEIVTPKQIDDVFAAAAAIT